MHLYSMRREQFASAVSLLEETREYAYKSLNSIPDDDPKDPMIAFTAELAEPTFIAAAHPKIGIMYPGTSVLIYTDKNPDPTVNPGDFRVSIPPNPGIVRVENLEEKPEIKVYTNVGFDHGRPVVVNPTIVYATKEHMYIEEPAKPIKNGVPSLGVPSMTYYHIYPHAKAPMDIGIKFRKDAPYTSLQEFDVNSQQLFMSQATRHLHVANASLITILSFPTPLPGIRI